MTTTPEALDPSNAEAMARAVARDAGVEIRLLDSLPDLGTLSRLLDSIWLVPRGGSPQIPLEQLRAMAHAGNYVAGAYAGKRLVAGSVGFFGAPADRSLHSHITGSQNALAVVTSAMHSRSIKELGRCHWGWTGSRGLSIR